MRVSMAIQNFERTTHSQCPVSIKGPTMVGSETIFKIEVLKRLGNAMLGMGIRNNRAILLLR